MNKIRKNFNDYSKNFDLKNKHIMGKFHHSYRVMEFCKEIATSINLSDEDVKIAMICGLLHDIGRFNQWTNYQTYEDHLSVDHGDEGYDVLITNDFIKEFVQDEDTIKIVLNSVKYHNKKDLPELDERNLLFLKITRDADKLDIMKEQCNEINVNEIILKKELLDDIYSKKICKNEYVENEVDAIIRMLAWVFDLNFEYSYQYLIDKKILENKFALLEMYGETNELNKLKEFIMKETIKHVR